MVGREMGEVTNFTTHSTHAISFDDAELNYPCYVFHHGKCNQYPSLKDGTFDTALSTLVLSALSLIEHTLTIVCVTLLIVCVYLLEDRPHCSLTMRERRLKFKIFTEQVVKQS